MNQLIHASGYDDYYALKKGLSAPVQDAPFIELDWSWLQERSRYAGAGLFGITGMACEGCAWLVRQLIARQVRIIDWEIHMAPPSISIQWSDGADIAGLAKDLQRYGFILESAPKCAKPSTPSPLPLAIGLVFLANAVILQIPARVGEDDFALTRLFDMLSLLFTLLGLLTTGYYLSRILRYRKFRSSEKDQPRV